MIQDSRVRILADGPILRGDYVLYWMQASQRTRFNHALEYAIGRANELGLPVVVGFGLMDDYPEANLRHYAFMVRGFVDIGEALRLRGIRLVIRRGNPPEVATELARRAALVVCDRGYLRHQRRWREYVADHAGRCVVEVESDVVVPVEAASDKQEVGARTLRPKIQRLLKRYLVPLKESRPKCSSMKLRIGTDLDWAKPDRILDALKVERSVAPSPMLLGGEREARRRLTAFVSGALARYDEAADEPSEDATSFLSPYLHFGQISPIEIALAVQQARSAPQTARDAYLEQLVVRRELAVNFVTFCPDYDSYEAVPAWARRTLERHANDPRPRLYSIEELETARTHDPYWNAAQKQMLATGYMHNYMRMYWGKKILEWMRSPREAFATALYLNNKYFVDGRDPTSYANVGWLFGLHDRPWGERPIFGQVRYMNAAGLERKFDMDAYVANRPTRAGGCGQGY